MARQNVDIGVQGNDGTGDSIRESFRKVNDNFIQLFAIFGSGDTIAFTDLDDTPNSYAGDQVIVANTDGDALLAKALVGGEGISVDHSDENEIRIISTGGKVGNDVEPTLGGHLDAQRFIIGNLAEPTDETANAFNVVHDTAITADNLVITKGYADQRYLQASGGPGAGSQIRVRSEPLSKAEYYISIEDWVDIGYARIPLHGFNSGSNGIAFRYVNAGSTPATGLSNGGTYYLRFVDKNRLSVHATREDATDGLSRILVNESPTVSAINRGAEQFVDANLDLDLEGNWVSNEALPRKSVVRRQGDTMEGALILSRNPTPQDDISNGGLVAATKFYVDNSSFASDSNLFVATSGDDTQADTPPGKEGRAFAYAYATVGAACFKAEELINASLTEPGPYRQLMTYANNNNLCYLNSVATGTGARRTLNVFSNGSGVDQSKDILNRDLREGSIIKGIRSGATGRVINYNGTLGADDVYVIELLHTLSDITQFQSDYKYAAQNLEDNRDFIAAEVVEFIKAKYPSLTFNETKCSRDAGLIVDALVHDTRYGGNTKTIKAARAYFTGAISVLSEVSEQLLPTIDGINYINLLAQQIIENNIIGVPPDDISLGKRSTEIQETAGGDAEAGSGTLVTRLINSIKDIVANGTNGSNIALEFISNEQLEFGQPVPELQITVRVESGIYYEQLPIRVPTNVSIKGDEFRRSIIRPAPGVSQSPWAGIYFYRDSEFDGLTRTYTTNSLTASSSGTTVTLATGSITGLEVGMYLYALAGTGTFSPATQVTRLVSASSFEISQVPITPLSGATVRALNGSGLAPVGNNFGYHYLTDPTGVSGIFPSTPTSGNTGAATRLSNSKEFIKDEVVRYINAKYVPSFVYNQILCARDVGYIVDAIVYDITNGGTSRTIAAGQAYRRNASALIAITTQLTETLDGMDYVNQLAQLILDGTTIGSPVVSTGSGATVGKRGSLSPSSAGVVEAGADVFVADLITGIKNTIIGTSNPPKANKDMDVFLLNDGTILRNITAQGHGGFMCVLDPEGQIQTKSPYFQTCTSLSGSVNQQSFRGGMYIDGFSGNLPATIISKNSTTEILVNGLTVRAPGVPNSFYIAGERYQLNSVENYDRSAGTATLTLDASTPYTDTVPLGGTDIIIETPGNRSMLSNDFTQVNDLGYGLVANNNGISEAVSVFTYYNWVSYFANNGGQIRSLNGSSCNGEYGLKARGSDPNEVADPVVLGDDMVQTVKVFKRSTFASKNLAADQTIYIDFYSYVSGTTQPSIFNVSEIEIDHSNTNSSIVNNTPSMPNNITIGVAGTGYAVGDLIDVDGGTLYTGGLKTRFRVTQVDGGGAGPGAITGFEVIEGGNYSINPVGGYPTVRGSVTTTVALPGVGVGAEFVGSYLGDIVSYELSNLEITSTVGSGVNSGGSLGTRSVIKLNLNSGSNSAGLRAPLEDGQIITIRPLQNFRFTGVERVRPVRPSTALEFTAPSELGDIYRTLSYSLSYASGTSLLTTRSISAVKRELSIATVTTGLTPHGLNSGDVVTVVCSSDSTFNVTSGVVLTAPDLYNFTYSNAGTTVNPAVAGTGTVSYGNQAVLSFDTSFDYTLVQTEPANLTGGYGSAAGDTKIAVVSVSSSNTIAKLNSGLLTTSWAGRIHIITGYAAAAGPVPAHITVRSAPLAYGSGTIVDPATDPVATGIRIGFDQYQSYNLRAGLRAGEPAEITVNISTCRATGHDFLDIGSGGFNSTNYPNNLLGAPEKAPSRVKEVVEETSGRVFYVSTDQYGIFRVGKFFTVDQGTGTVTFAASIALSNLDGIGFKRGTVVKEFSTDNTMTDNADDTVPVESAIRGYIDKRLGYTHTGSLVPLGERIPATTGGFLPTAGSPALSADLDMAGNGVGHRITNLVPLVTSDSDAANIGYVDQQVDLRDSFYKLRDVNVMTPAVGDIALFTGAGKHVISTSITGELSSEFTSSSIAQLTADYLSPSTASTLTVDDITGFPESGHLKIGNEIFSYTGTTEASNRFDGVVRALFLTTAADHLTGADVLSLDNSSIELTINDNVIYNRHVNAAAAVEQSKLSMTLASTRAAAPTGAAADKQAASGLASFDEDNFEITDGFVGIKAGGVALSEITNIAAGSILGNLTIAAAAPQEVTTSGIVQNGINSLFSTVQPGGRVMVRRSGSLKPDPDGTTFTIDGTPTPASGTSGQYENIPVSNVVGSSTANGALVTVGYSSGSYSGISCTFGGNGYTLGDQLIIKGSLLGGADGIHDISFTVDNVPGNVDAVVYYELSKVSVSAEADSIIKTDAASNLGNPANKFNNVYATSFIGTPSAPSITKTGTNETGDIGQSTNVFNKVWANEFAGKAGSAGVSDHLKGTTIGGVFYVSGTNTTTELVPGTSGRFLMTQGTGAAPKWEAITIPTGAAGDLTGTTLAATVVNSSLETLGTLSALNIGVGNITVNSNKFTVNGGSGAVYAAGNLQVGGLIRKSADTGIVSAGTVQGDAVPLVAEINIISTVAAGTGVVFPSAAAGYTLIVKNAGLLNLTVYPASGDRINDDLVNSPVILEPGAALQFFTADSTNWYTLNATFA